MESLDFELIHLSEKPQEHIANRFGLRKIYALFMSFTRKKLC